MFPPLLPHAIMFCAFTSYPPVFNEPPGEEGLFEGGCLSVAFTLTLNIC